MTLIRLIEIENFRSVKALKWQPCEGINCLVGPGDSGKSTVLDAIDYCIGARRSLQVTDADFAALDIEKPVRICVTLGALPDGLKSMETYGLYLGGFNAATGEISPEPGAGLETVLTVQLLVDSDLEPQWSLVSQRAAAQGQSRSLNWGDRVQLSPTRLGAINDNNLTWRRGSLLNRLSEERADASKELAKAARDVRAAFGAQANAQLAEALATVTRTAKSLGIPVGAEVKALLDAASVSFSGSTISLHDEAGVPLRGLGLGSTRLLIAGLQRQAAANASIVLIDELEHGLEPHRIIMLLGALGAKDKPAPLQVFMTTHSPVAVRELAADQLFVLRQQRDLHHALAVGAAGDVQGTIRKYPDALLATTVFVCEGASEVGLMRGIDQFRAAQGHPPIAACGCALVDGGGSELFARALAFQALGYRVATMRDSDVHPTPELEAKFTAAGGTAFRWREGRALEDEVFLSVGSATVTKLLEVAVAAKEESLINEHIKTASLNAINLVSIKAECAEALSPASRAILGKAARLKGSKGWFKSVGLMEQATRDIIAPELPQADPAIGQLIDSIFKWIADGGR
ncbi:ATP-dependent nuclease [Humitalea sp. 24SJ18S-53]|uniref:ATP-dependent nuclease n=1 Tax=Humitalea sp. 24SJ18S-53 TaxID=3422307 RepID=UPI003D669F39